MRQVIEFTLAPVVQRTRRVSRVELVTSHQSAHVRFNAEEDRVPHGDRVVEMSGTCVLVTRRKGCSLDPRLNQTRYDLEEYRRQGHEAHRRPHTAKGMVAGGAGRQIGAAARARRGDTGP